MKRIGVAFLSVLCCLNLFSQPVPAPDENIPYLMTFGPKAERSWGDDDFSQTFFFQIPKTYTGSFCIRIFDPEVGGMHDEENGEFDTRVTYSLFGGVGCFTHEDAKGIDPVGEYKSGNLLATKSFTSDPAFDDKWFTFGPFNVTEGELYEEWGGHYMFKLICDGISGDDGNLYRYYLSAEKNTNKEVEGGNAFAYEYSFRMHDDPNEISHIYPYVDNQAISVKQRNFDWDGDGNIRVVSVARQGQIMKVSGESEWIEDEMKILEAEKTTSLDFQFIKKRPAVRNNNVVVNVRNQFDEYMRFYVVPIGGVPRYQAKVGAKPLN